MPAAHRLSVVVLLSIASAASAASAGCGHGGPSEIRKDDSSTGPHAGDGTTTAGSRLVPLSYHGSDGSKSFFGLFDKQLGKPCAFDQLGSFGVCVPPDVYTVSAEIFGNSLKTASPALFLDASCSERKAIALDESAECTHYGVIRITGSAPMTDYPGCARPDYGTGLAVVTAVPAGTKVYAYGQGGGQCCSCKEWVPPSGRRAYLVAANPDENAIAGIKLVTGKIELPTAP